MREAGVESLVGGDVSTSRQDTEGDLMCCNRNHRNPAVVVVRNRANRALASYLCEFGEEVIDRGVKVKETLAIARQAAPGRAQTENTPTLIKVVWRSRDSCLLMSL